MKSSPRTFLILSLVAFLGFGVAYILAFERVLGSPKLRVEYWTKALYDYKYYAAKQIEEPKLIVLAGSNGMFGINSNVLEKRMQRQTVNLALHADLDISFLYQQADDLLAEGDLLVMPLEYSYYESSDSFNISFVRYMMAWGNEIYLKNLSLLDYLGFIKAVPKLEVWLGLVSPSNFKRLDRTKEVLYPGPDVIVREVLRNNKRRNRVVFSGYSHNSLNLNGDIMASRSTQQSVRDIVSLPEKHDSYFEVKDEISPHFIRHFKRIQALAEERGAQVVLTWPATIRHAGLDLTKREDQLRIERLRSLLSASGIDLACNPGFFNLDHRLFFDTSYHLRERGAILRTEALAQCLSELDQQKGSSHKPVDWAKSLKILSHHESRMLGR